MIIVPVTNASITDLWRMAYLCTKNETSFSHFFFGSWFMFHRGQTMFHVAEATGLLVITRAEAKHPT